MNFKVVSIMLCVCLASLAQSDEGATQLNHGNNDRAPQLPAIACGKKDSPKKQEPKDSPKGIKEGQSKVDKTIGNNKGDDKKNTNGKVFISRGERSRGKVFISTGEQSRGKCTVNGQVIPC
jgi:hypothetical protein